MTMETDLSVLTRTDTLHFEPCSREMIPLLTKLFKKFPSRSCDFSLAGIYMWKEYLDYQCCFLNNTFFLKGKSPDSGCDIFYRPIGCLGEDEGIDIIREYCRRNDVKGSLLLSETVLGNPEEIRGYDPLHYIDDWKEYLYDIDRFVRFPGKKMEKKRNHYNFFVSHFEDRRIEMIGPENIEELVAFTRRFCQSHSGDELLDYEGEKTIDALHDYDSYPYHGILIRIGGRVAGFTFGEHSGDTFFVHVEKGDIEYRGIYQGLASFLAEDVKSRYPEVRWLNREEDMGNEDLRRSKMSYHPAGFVVKRIVEV